MSPPLQHITTALPHPRSVAAHPVLKARGRTVPMGDGPLIMGIVNINDDSFSGDGRVDPCWAVSRAVELADEGAHLIDLGAESARTNRPPISEEEEVRRLLPAVEGFVQAFRDHPSPPLLSINTWRPGVVARILPAGGDLLNDMGGLPDDRNARLCARHGAALLIMHTIGDPKVAHTRVTYPDVMMSLRSFFVQKMDAACAAGLSRESILLDPGIDFAKQSEANLSIYRNLSRLAELNRPILLPISRKGVIGKVLGIKDPTGRDAGTAACLVAGMLRGASIFRVHHVGMARATIAAVRAVLGSAPADE